MYYNKISYSFFLLTLIIAPVLFAGNRPYVFYGLQSCVALSVISYLLACIKAPSHTLIVENKNYSYIFSFFLIVLLWGVIQLIPFMPVGIAHPIWAMASNGLGIELGASISSNRYETVQSLSQFMTYGLMFFLAMQFSADKERASQIIKVILCTCAACVFYGVVLYSLQIEKVLWIDKPMYKGSLTGTFINRNSFATYIGIGLIISVIYFHRTLIRNTSGYQGADLFSAILTNFSHKAFPYFFLTVFFIAAIILTHSRAGLVASFVGLVFTLMLLQIKSKLSAKYKYALSTIIVLGLLSFLMGGGETFIDRLELLVEKGDLRENIFLITMNAISANMWVGTGLGTFEHNFSMYRDTSFPFDFWGRIDHAHNSYLETILELGLPVFIVFATVFIFVAVRLFRGYTQRKRSRHFSLIALGALCVVLLHALLDFSIEMPAVAMVVATLMGVGFAQSFSSKISLTISFAAASKANKRTTYLISCFAITVLLISLSNYPTAILNYQFNSLYARVADKEEVQQHEYEELAYQHERFLFFPFESNILRKNLMYLKRDLVGLRTLDSNLSMHVKAETLYFAKKALTKMPLNSYLWIVYGRLLLDSESDYKRAANAIYISGLISPFKKETFMFRLYYLPLLWSHFSEEQQEFFKKDIRNVWDYSNKYQKRRIVGVISSSAMGTMLMFQALSEAGDNSRAEEYFRILR